MMKEETFKLEHPIEVDGVMTDTLKLRRPKVRDIKMMDQYPGDVEKSIYLLSALCEIPPDAVEEMDANDFGRISEKVSGFMPSAGRMSGF